MREILCMLSPDILPSLWYSSQCLQSLQPSNIPLQLRVVVNINTTWVLFPRPASQDEHQFPVQGWGLLSNLFHLLLLQLVGELQAPMWRGNWAPPSTLWMWGPGWGCTCCRLVPTFAWISPIRLSLDLINDYLRLIVPMLGQHNKRWFSSTYL